MGAAAVVALAGGLSSGGREQRPQELSVSRLHLIPDFLHRWVVHCILFCLSQALAHKTQLPQPRINPWTRPALRMWTCIRISPGCEPLPSAVLDVESRLPSKANPPPSSPPRQLILQPTDGVHVLPRSSQHDATTMDLAKSAKTFLETAKGIMQDVRTHALSGDVKFDKGVKLASVMDGAGHEGVNKPVGGILGTITGDAAKLAPRHINFYQGQELADAANSTDAVAAGGAGADAAPAEGHDDAAAKPKVLGAAGAEVFGGANSSITGFMGFSKKEPSFLGIPFPILMFLGVVCGCALCITTGCLIARNTDVLKVNVDKKAVEEEEEEEEEDDEKDYYWRKQNAEPV